MGKQLDKLALAIRCPTCGAPPGVSCELNTGQPRTEPHRERRVISDDEGPRRELATLSRQHNEALQTGTFITMSQQETAQFDQRASRMWEICGMLGKFRRPILEKH
jgi:hypothetical protein